MSRSGTVTSIAGSAADQFNNPSIQNAVAILEQLSDLGRALPFIAPAFVLLSLIIQVEKKARDADAKCNDLVDRITFMLGHLGALRRLKVADPTRKVIDRMNDVLKDCASLIQAYRKQNAIARRLNFSNRDNFVSCVTAVNSCSNDLMLSLQIHQSSQLDILTRSIPFDAEDMAAETFVTLHGGVKAVKEDPTLVTQFADELQLKMDDTVMEQIHTNLSDLVEENHARLERMLKDNVGTAVATGIKELVDQLNEADMEQRFICVQCDAPFRNSTNGSKSCNFHRAEYSSWDRRNPYSCCGTENPCQWGSHRAKHHCDYPYGNFYGRVSKINNYVDTVDQWASVEDKNLVSNDMQKAYVGGLLRWVSQGDFVNEPTVIISVGSIWYTNPYFFDTFTTNDLQSISRVVRMTGNTQIFRTSPDTSEFSMAEWVLSPEGAITGVRITAKAATSSTPFVKVCPINIAKCAKSGEVLSLSEGGMRAFKPKTPYVLPEAVRVSPELSDKPIRPTRTNFKTCTTPELPVILKVTSDPPLKPNPDFASYDSDNFEGVVSVFNKSSVDSKNPITISSISASFRFLGEDTYAPVKSFKVLDGWELPITIEPRQSWPLRFQVVLPRSEEDTKLQARWFNRAFIARKRPIRVKLLFEEIEGEECSIVLEHVFNPLFPLDKKKENDIDYFFFDEPELYSRNGIHVEKSSNDSEVIKFSGATGDSTINISRLQKVVYHAVQTGETEVDLEIGGERSDGAWEWGVWALVDLACNRVYAFKILLTQGRLVSKKTMACLGYVLCPDYGNFVDEQRAAQLAMEKVGFPQLEPLVVEDVLKDDTVDDNVSALPTSSSTTSSVPSSLPIASMIIPEELTARLTSIDTNLARIATAVELLLGHLTKKPETPAQTWHRR